MIKVSAATGRLFTMTKIAVKRLLIMRIAFAAFAKITVVVFLCHKARPHFLKVYVFFVSQIIQNDKSDTQDFERISYTKTA